MLTIIITFKNKTLMNTNNNIQKTHVSDLVIMIIITYYALYTYIYVPLCHHDVWFHSSHFPILGLPR